MTLSYNQKYILYLFYSFYLFNKDYKTDRFNEILNIVNKNWYQNNTKEVETLAKYIDYIFDKYNLSHKNSRKYVNEDIKYDNIYNIYLKESRKFKLSNNILV